MQQEFLKFQRNLKNSCGLLCLLYEEIIFKKQGIAVLIIKLPLVICRKKNLQYYKLQTYKNYYHNQIGWKNISNTGLEIKWIFSIDTNDDFIHARWIF